VELPGFHGHACSRARPSVLAQPPDHHHLPGLNRRRRLSLMARDGPPPRRPGRRLRARLPPRAGHVTTGLAILVGGLSAAATVDRSSLATAAPASWPPAPSPPPRYHPRRPLRMPLHPRRRRLARVVAPPTRRRYLRPLTLDDEALPAISRITAGDGSEAPPARTVGSVFKTLKY
jgi:hypothetical protein